jgi:hypothetical protein
MRTEYRKIAKLLYEIFRNGVAHSYVPKGAALLSSNYCDRNRHLKFYSNGLFIYVPQLARDLRSSIRAFYQDIKSNAALKNNYNNVIRQLDTEGSEKYRDHLSKACITPIAQNIKRDIVTALI